PIDCLVLEESLLHEISKSVPFSFDLYLQQPLCPFQNVYFQFVALASERKSSANRRLSTFLQTLQRSMWPDSTNSFPHFEQYAFVTPRSRPTLLSFALPCPV